MGAVELHHKARAQNSKVFEVDWWNGHQIDGHIVNARTRLVRSTVIPPQIISGGRRRQRRIAISVGGAVRGSNRRRSANVVANTSRCRHIAIKWREHRRIHSLVVNIIHVSSRRHGS